MCIMSYLCHIKNIKSTYNYLQQQKRKKDTEIMTIVLMKIRLLNVKINIKSDLYRIFFSVFFFFLFIEEKSDKKKPFQCNKKSDRETQRIKKKKH